MGNLDVEGQAFTSDGLLAFRRKFRFLSIVTVVLAVVCAVLLGLIIAVALEIPELHDDIDGLKGFHDEEEFGGAVQLLSTREALESVGVSGRVEDKDGAKIVSPVFQGTGYWALRQKMPAKRSDHQVVAVKDTIYIFGGLGTDNAVLDETLIYDTVLDTYTEGPKLPGPLYRYAIAFEPNPTMQDDGNIYLIGGLNDSDFSATQLSATHVFNLGTGKWTKGPKLNTARSDFCAAYVEGKIYVAGGWGVGYETTLDTVEVLDLTKKDKKWEEVQSMPTPRGDCKCAALDGKFVVLGGYYDPKNEWNPDSFRGEVEAYDPVTETWGKLSPLPNARGDKAVVTLPGSRLLVMGGETHSRGQRTQVATHHVEEYLASHDVWVNKVPLIYPRFRTDAAYVDGAVYLFGGHAICGEGDNNCPETAEAQVYFDIDHPDIFFVTQKN